MNFEAVVEVKLREGVADPEGATILAAMKALGFEGFSAVSSGKSFRLLLEAADAAEAAARAGEVAHRLLANPVLEESSVTVMQQGDKR